jgi:hypothetical protein
MVPMVAVGDRLSLKLAFWTTGKASPSEATDITVGLQALTNPICGIVDPTAPKSIDRRLIIVIGGSIGTMRL